MKYLFTLLAALLFPLTIAAQTERAFSVWQAVADAFTGKYIKDATVTLLSKDSTRIDSGHWEYNSNNNVILNSLYIVNNIKSGIDYIVKIEHPDYQTLFIPLHIKVKKRSKDIVSIEKVAEMTRRPKTKKLGEAVVRATKIQLVNKKDTIIYNADAFQLAEGSMLDALIEQLPGAKLDENGVITVNGKIISSLLVNGRDFFHGNPKVALENLPAYMVNKVKVYEKSSFEEEITGKKAANRPLVMDVNLKRQYATSWVNNTEAAGGTEEKYLGRLFGLRFSDRSHIAVYGNVNNTNDTRRAGAQGNWTPAYLPQGIQTSQTAGAEYNFENKLNTVQLTSNVTFEHHDNLLEKSQNEERFLSSNQAFGMRQEQRSQQNTTITSDHKLEFTPKRGTIHSALLNLRYDNNHTNENIYAGEFSNDPLTLFSRSQVIDALASPNSNLLQNIQRNRRNVATHSRGSNWNISLPYSFTWYPLISYGITDMVTCNISGNYDRHEDQYFDHYWLSTRNNGQDQRDFRNRYYNTSNHHYTWSGNASYSWAIKAWRPTIEYRYEQDYRSNTSEIYRLDRLQGWDNETDHSLGDLPSNLLEMQHALDQPNSGHSMNLRKVHELIPSIHYDRRGRYRTDFRIAVPIRWQIDNLRYHYTGQRYKQSRNSLYIVPSAEFTQQIGIRNYSLAFIAKYNLSTQLPDLFHALNITNNANPLYITRGNNHLERSITHSFQLNFNLRNLRNRSAPLYVVLHFNRTHNAIATERNYNPTTGGYEMRPVNIDGNWNASAYINNMGLFGKSREFSWSNQASVNYQHSVDMANVIGAAINTLSTIQTSYFSENFTLNYSRNGWNLGAKAKVGYNHLTGDRSDFVAFSAWDYHYGITARIPLPAKFSLNTDITVFSRRGYSDRNLNTDNFVWNAHIERTILHGHLTLSLDGFDILHNLSNITRTLNSQGRTEVYTNVVPSYLMLHAIYKWSFSPKKKH